MELNSDLINDIAENQPSKDIIVKKVKFNRDTLKNLTMIASREYFDSNKKIDDCLSEIINNMANDYFKEYIKNLK